MNELFNIKDNVVVITGGTGVLGRTIAKYLAKNGAQVIILGRKESIGKEIVDDIVKDGGKAEFFVVGADRTAAHHQREFDFDETGLETAFGIFRRTLEKLNGC